MTETRSYELTQEQVLEICEALKFQADDLDHREGSRADIKDWSAKAASLWALIDKFLLETPGIRGLSTVLPEVACRKEPPSWPDTPSMENGQPATAKSIVGKNFLPAAFIFLSTCLVLLDPHMMPHMMPYMIRNTILGKLLGGIISGLLLVWLGSNFCRAIRSRDPRYANYVGIGLYWIFIVMSLFMVGGIAYFEIYLGYSVVGVGRGLSDAALFWVIALGARRALTGRAQTLSSE
jgi:hypothetical protein